MRRPASDHVLATVMFVDMVGSSEVAGEMGDRRWRVLLDRYHRTLRATVARYGGREMDSAGDGVFVLFTDQEYAVRCACAVAEDVQKLGVDVRAGVHAGRAERVGKKVGGISVHIGARVMAAAGAAEVLVSGVVHDLISGSGVDLDDRGWHHLKGIVDEVRLYAVTGLDGARRPEALDPDEARRRRDEVQQPPLLTRRPVRRILVGAALALLLAGVAVGAALSGGPHAVVIHPYSILRIDAHTGKILADIPVNNPAGTQLAVVPPHTIATLNQAQGLITEIDASTNRRTPTGIQGLFLPGTAAAQSSGLGYARGDLWMADTKRTVTEINPEGGIIQRYRLSGNPTMVTTSGGVPWVIGWNGQVYAFDPSTGSFVQRGRMGGWATGAVAGEGAVWVVDSGDNTVARIAPGSGRVTRIGVGVGSFAIAVGLNSIWTNNLGSNTTRQTVSRIDPETRRVVAKFQVCPAGGQENFTGIAVAGGDVWASCPVSNTVLRISPQGRVLERIPVRYIPQGMVAAYGSIWVAISRY
jgi:class 3 adenylate cyclase